MNKDKYLFIAGVIMCFNLQISILLFFVTYLFPHWLNLIFLYLFCFVFALNSAQIARLIER